MLPLSARIAGPARISALQPVDDLRQQRRAFDLAQRGLRIQTDGLLFPEDARRDGAVGPDHHRVAGPGAAGDRGPEPAAQPLPVVEARPPAHQAAAQANPLAVVEVRVGDETKPAGRRVLGRGGELGAKRAGVLVVEQFVLGAHVSGRRHEADVELTGADFLGEARQVGEIAAVRPHPHEDQPQPRRRAPPHLVQQVERTHQPVELAADPDRLVGLRARAVHRHADRVHSGLADRLGLGGRQRQQVGREPQVGNAVAAGFANDVDELRMHQRLGRAAQGDPAGAGEEIGRDPGEGLHRHHAVSGQLAVEGQELQPVDRREVAHLALQVAALGGVEDDLQRTALERGHGQSSRGRPEGRRTDIRGRPEGRRTDRGSERDDFTWGGPPASSGRRRGRNSAGAIPRRC